MYLIHLRQDLNVLILHMIVSLLKVLIYLKFTCFDLLTSETVSYKAMIITLFSA